MNLALFNLIFTGVLGLLILIIFVVSLVYLVKGKKNNGTPGDIIRTKVSYYAAKVFFIFSILETLLYAGLIASYFLIDGVKKDLFIYSSLGFIVIILFFLITVILIRSKEKKLLRA